MPTYGDRYRVLDRLGSGAMATVYLAEDETLGRKVAVKRMRAETSDEDAERFRREAKMAASLNHPNVVRVYDTLTEDEDVLIVMEYVDGVDLGERLKTGAVRPHLALSILRDVAAGLDHAHAQGLIHRDVKPQNILLGSNGETKLTDLGIAKAEQNTALTQADAFLGTPQYMAPEQIKSEPTTKATDVFSLAMVAFQMLSGKPPRGSGSIPEVAHRAVNMPPPDIREAWPDAPEGVGEVMSRALDRDPAKRPQSATELVTGLEAALVGTGEVRTVAAPAAPVAVAAPPDPPTPVAEEPAVEAPPPEPTRPRPVRREEPAPRRAPAPAPTSPAQRGQKPWLGRALAGLALLGVAVVALLLITGGSDDPEGGGTTASDSPPAEETQTGGDSSGDSSGEGSGEGESSGETEGSGGETGESESGGEGSGSGSGSGETVADADADAEAAAKAVQDFYVLAADDDYAGASAVATENVLAEVDPIEGTFAPVESIEFTSIEATNVTATSAQVDFTTVSTQVSKTEDCTGSATVVNEGGTWLLDDLLGVSCVPR